MKETNIKQTHKEDKHFNTINDQNINESLNQQTSDDYNEMDQINKSIEMVNLFEN